MKRNMGGLFASILLVLVFLQSAPAMELSAGVRLGGTMSGILGDTVKLMMPRFGLCFGGFASEWINDKFGLQEELVFVFRGESMKSTDSVNPISNIYPNQFIYLEVPILAKWKFLKWERYRPVLYGGPNIAFPIVADAVTVGGNTIKKIPETQPVDVGITVGLSLDILRGSAVIPIDIRYTMGFIDFLKREELITPYDIRLTHSVLSVSAGLGWIFDFTKKKEF